MGLNPPQSQPRALREPDAAASSQRHGRPERQHVPPPPARFKAGQRATGKDAANSNDKRPHAPAREPRERERDGERHTHPMIARAADHEDRHTRREHDGNADEQRRI